MKQLQQIIGKGAKKTILRPPWVRRCSQTVYQFLLGCVRMFKATGDERWKNRSERLVKLLVEQQGKDGGFDIGYDFNFGLQHRKGESSAPEMFSLVALCEFLEIGRVAWVENAAERAAEWIKSNTVSFPNDKAAIPYCPRATSDVVVVNGTSFACGGLGAFLGVVRRDPEIEKIYRQYISYLDGSLENVGQPKLALWPYHELKYRSIDELGCYKIDYYHQMQQVEVHSIAERYFPVAEQLHLIKKTADSIYQIANSHGVLPYTNKYKGCPNTIHIWGLASVVSGFLAAGQIVEKQRERYNSIAERELNWILSNSWNGEYFRPIVQNDGSTFWMDRYMVRSDAWVFNAIASHRLYSGPNDLERIAEKVFLKADYEDYSGYETHASNARTRLVGAIATKIKDMLVRKRDLKSSV